MPEVYPPPVGLHAWRADNPGKYESISPVEDPENQKVCEKGTWGGRVHGPIGSSS
jgi:hypothetical protein